MRNMPRRILLLITDLEIGGTPTVVRELAIRLSREPWCEHVHVACLDKWGPVADQLRGRSIAVTSLGACCRFDIHVIVRLIRLIRRELINTVLSFLIHANMAASLASIVRRRVRYLQSIQTTQPHPRWHWKLQRRVHCAAERIVVPSPSVAAAAQQWAGIPAGKIDVISNAVESGEFKLPRDRSSGKRVGFIGRLDPIKRVENLVSAVSMLGADVYLDIFGDGPCRTDIQRTIDQSNLGERIKLHGAVPGAAQALAGMDVLVLPSDAEGFGLVLIEAMAAGVPVIGTNVPGIRDVINDGVNGLLTPPRDPVKLAAAIERVLSEDELTAKLIAGGAAAVAEKYSWQVVLPQYINLLRQ